MVGWLKMIDSYQKKGESRQFWTEIDPKIYYPSGL